MEVILKEDVINLGYKDDIVNVKRGYGRNYLIPTGKAVIATESARKVLAENLRQRAHKLAQIKANAEELAAKINDITLTIKAKTSSTGTIFGSVNNIQVAEELAKLGDFYVNEAFGAAHRKHTSTAKVAHILKPAVAGLLMEKEIRCLSQALDNPTQDLWLYL